MPFVPGHSASAQFWDRGRLVSCSSSAGAERLLQISDEDEMSARAAALTMIGKECRLYMPAAMSYGDLRRRLLITGLWKANASENPEHQSRGINS